MLRKFLVLALVLVLTTGMLVACGSSEEDEGSSAGKKSGKEPDAGRTESTPVETVRLAYKTTVEEQTARVVSNVRTSATPMGATTENQAPIEFAVSSRGVVDLAEQKSLMTVKMEMLGEMEIRQIGGIAYQKIPPDMQAQIQGVKPWIKMDVDAFYREQYGASLSEMQSGAPTDPAQQLEYLKSVGSVREIGQEQVRSVPTTHYRAVVDLKKEADMTGDPDVQKAYKKLRDMIGSSPLPIDVWLDGKDRVRRYAMDMNLEVDAPVDPTASDGATEKVRTQVSMTEDIFDFGVPVNVSPPPPENTMGYEEFQRKVQQQMQQQPQQQAAPDQKT